MKVKTLIPIAFMGLAIMFSCQGNPSKKAENVANKEARQAESEANKAQDHLDKSVEHANKAVDHATMEELNAAVANVEVPKFDDIDANEAVKKIGNLAVDFINSDNNQEAGKYADKINEQVASIMKKVENGSISQEDGQMIQQYAQNVASALGITL